MGLLSKCAVSQLQAYITQKSMIFSTTRYIATAGKYEDQSHAAMYKKYRPEYPSFIKTSIINYITAKNPKCTFKNMLDVGCGSGQATMMWQNDFEKINGIDVSAEQIRHAPADIDRVRFSVGSADNLEFEDASMDLVTIAMALHWVDRDRFYSEVKRVLKPGGVLAAFGHNYLKVKLDNETANDILLNEFEKEFRTPHHWAKNLKAVENSYQDFRFPLQHFQRIQMNNIIDSWTFDRLMGRYASSTFYQSYIKANPDSNILADTRTRLEKEYHGRNPMITIPMFLLLGQKSFKV